MRSSLFCSSDFKLGLDCRLITRASVVAATIFSCWCCQKAAQTGTRDCRTQKAATLLRKNGGANQIAALNLLHFYWLINVLPLLLRFYVRIRDLKTKQKIFVRSNDRISSGQPEDSREKWQLLLPSKHSNLEHKFQSKIGSFWTLSQSQCSELLWSLVGILWAEHETRIIKKSFATPFTFYQI